MQEDSIAELMPTWPLCLDLLPLELQQAAGRCHDDGQEAHTMLLALGFRPTQHADVVDRGPWLALRCAS